MAYGNLVNGTLNYVKKAGKWVGSGMQSGYNKVSGPTLMGHDRLRAYKRAMSGYSKYDVPMGTQARIAGKFAKGYFSAADLKGKGLTRAGAVAARAGTTSVGLGVGMSVAGGVADFFNPFSLGFDD